MGNCISSSGITSNCYGKSSKKLDDVPPGGYMYQLMGTSDSGTTSRATPYTAGDMMRDVNTMRDRNTLNDMHFWQAYNHRPWR